MPSSFRAVRRLVPASIFLLLLALPAAADSAPILTSSATIDFDYWEFNATKTVPAEIFVRFPNETQCAQSIPIHLALDHPVPNATVEIDPPNGTLMPAPGVERSFPFVFRVTLNRTVPAYSRPTVEIRVTTGPCVGGNLSSATTVFQVGAFVKFRPEVAMGIADFSNGQWTVWIENKSNADVRIQWRVVQPSRGRSGAGSDAHLKDPTVDLVGANSVLHVPSAGVDFNFSAFLDVGIHYQGGYPAGPDLRPESGYQVLDLYTPATPAKSSWLRYAALGAAIGLLILAAVVHEVWKRQKKRRQRRE